MTTVANHYFVLVSLLYLLLFSGLNYLVMEAFINYNFSYKRFTAHKNFSGEHLCKWETVPVKKQTCTLLITLWNSGRKCAKLVFKPFAVNQSSSVLCITPFVQITLFQLIWCLFSILVQSASIYITVLPFLMNLNEKRCSESNMLTMDFKLVLENSSSVVV